MCWTLAARENSVCSVREKSDSQHALFCIFAHCAARFAPVSARQPGASETSGSAMQLPGSHIIEPCDCRRPCGARCGPCIRARSPQKTCSTCVREVRDAGKAPLLVAAELPGSSVF